MKDKFKPIYELNEQHLEELLSLFQLEWWTKDRTLDEIETKVKNSLIVALIHEETGELAGFARALTDNVFRAFIYNVIIKETCRKKG
ncbi:GNAT family N-acetyltransferase [Metabacillus sp. RGM 3146]|uniref:GNAT family N-acetyltransferase n=1 Tax=Metabacillus sp. RGM 3146 TaxID=3401092 RepID=UPI003B992C34